MIAEDLERRDERAAEALREVEQLETDVEELRTHAEATAGFLFREHDLVSNIEGRAAVTDPDLINPWGVAYGPDTPFWIAENGTDRIKVYDAEGRPSELIVEVS